MANQFSGDFSLKEVTLYSVYNTNPTDIKNLVLEINLYESVMSSALQAEILIQDIGQNLISSMPIVGQERINIKISSRSKLYDLNYYIYKIDARTIIEKDQTYIMHAVSIEGLRNENFRICERIDGKNSETVIEDVLRRNSFSTKPFVKDTSVFPFDMYVPNWRVFDLFNWLSTRSVPDYKKDSIGFYFYETFEGYRFKSIDKLIDQTQYPAPDISYKYSQANATTTSTSAADRYRIMNFNFPKVFDVYDDLRAGAFCHQAIYLDVNRATYRVFKTNADEFWDKSSHLEKAKPYLSNGQLQMLDRGSRFIYRPSTISTFGDWDNNQSDAEKDNIDDMNKNFEKAFYRYYFMQYNTIDIAVPGDLENRAGNVVSIDIPSPAESSSTSVKPDKRASGRYLVTSIKHTILNRSELRTNITLSRDSYGGSPMPDTKRSENRTNLDGTN
jgi:hypothetical protein|tara:strand:- start:768 stop:2099 length:1332 start_codon:yes stop_codon:yes gene_type:complete